MKFSTYTKVQKRLLLSIGVVSILILIVVGVGILWLQTVMTSVDADIYIPINNTVPKSPPPELSIEQKLDILQTLIVTNTPLSNGGEQGQKDILTTLRNTLMDSTEPSPLENVSDLQVN